MTFPIVAGGGSGKYTVNKSLRFRGASSAYLSRNYGSVPGNTTTFTISVWLKRGAMASGTQYRLFDAAGNSNFYFSFSSATSDTLEFNLRGTGAANYPLNTTAVFRDPASWYHIVLAIDTTQATDTNRAKLYINNVQQTLTGTYCLQNQAQFDTVAVAERVIGTVGSPRGILSFDGYMTEFIWVDGQQLTPSSFGTSDPSTGVWQPKKYAGSYGTTGFYLPFTDNSFLTNGSNRGLGADYSGNGNWWNCNNFSITSGVTYDSMNDVPTPTSSSQANYPTLNPLVPANSGVTVSNGNLRFSNTNTAAAYEVPSTFGGISNSSDNAITPTRYYFEATFTQANNGGNNNAQFVGVSSTVYRSDGTDAGGAAFGATYTTGDVIGVAVDKTLNRISFYKNNVLQGSQATTVNLLKNIEVYGYYNVIWDINFGQQPFRYTPPVQFVAANSYNATEPTIVKSNQYMDINLYTGNAAQQTQYTNSSGTLWPDFLWVKSRSNATDHILANTNDGIQNFMNSNSTFQNQNDARVFRFVGSGFFNLGSDGTPSGSNILGNTYVAWQWQAGRGTNVPNTNGTISSQVSVSLTSGFSVVTYTGTGVNATVGHGLGVAPQLMIIKNRSVAGSWDVYHVSLGATQYLYLNSTVAVATSSTQFNNTNPTSTVFSLGTDNNGNGSGNSHVAYCWTPIAGYSSFGSYTGNASADGPFVYTGFRPRYLLIKNASAIQGWNVVDSSRTPYNLINGYLSPHANVAEATAYARVDFLSNGFKVRDIDAFTNGSGQTMIYAAFAENPFKYALAR